MTLPEETEPLVSVVIPSINGRPYITECLDALTRQDADVRHEIIVLDCCDQATRDEIERRFGAAVQLVPFEQRLSIPKLRSLGLERARGAMVAVLDDHCMVGPSFLGAVERGFHAGHPVLGGPVDNGATERWIDWAVFLFEYGRFMPPLEAGPVDGIAGGCAVYQRELLERVSDELGDEVWESFLHERMKQEGIEFYCDPDLLVHHKMEFGFWHFMGQRYHFSRSFAGMRLKTAPLLKRLLFAAITPAVPLLMLRRVAGVLWPKRSHRGTFVRSLPLIGAFLLSYAWGEAVGALLGPGDSLSKIE